MEEHLFSYTLFWDPCILLVLMQYKRKPLWGPGHTLCMAASQVQHTHTHGEWATVHMIAYHILLLIQDLPVQKRNVFGCRKSFGFVLKGFPPLFFLSAVLKSFSWCNQLKLSHRGHGICVRRRERHAWRPCLTDDQTEFRNLCILKWANRAPFLDGLGKMECHGAEQNYKLYIKKIWFGKQDVKISRNSCDFSEGSKLGCYGHTPTPHLLITYLT